MYICIGKTCYIVSNLYSYKNKKYLKAFRFLFDLFMYLVYSSIDTHFCYFGLIPYIFIYAFRFIAGTFCRKALKIIKGYRIQCCQIQ